MSEITPHPHHVRGVESESRPPYRRGRKATAVKVFTIADESQHILVFGVPTLNLLDQVTALGQKFGPVIVSKVEAYPNLEDFTELFHLQYSRLAAARTAKRRMDGREFYGGILHVCYAPELETVEETRSKIIQRSKQVYALIRDKGSKKFRSFDGGNVSGASGNV